MFHLTYSNLYITHTIVVFMKMTECVKKGSLQALKFEFDQRRETLQSTSNDWSIFLASSSPLGGFFRGKRRDNKELYNNIIAPPCSLIMNNLKRVFTLILWLISLQKKIHYIKPTKLRWYMDQQKCCGQNNINGGGEYFLICAAANIIWGGSGGAFRFEIYFF